MTSAIDATKPADAGLAVKADLRANLAAAKSEILALQTAVAAIPATVQNGMRNRIINGTMMLSQRYGGGLTSVPAGSVSIWGVDRWYGTSIAGGGVFSIQQFIGGGPAKFPAFIRISTTTAKAVLVAGDAHGVAQSIEGYHWNDLQWGTASAQTASVSFWVRSSVIGTYSIAMGSSAAANSCVNTYTINAANTWEYKTIAFAAPVTGAFGTTTGTGAGLRFDLGSGSTWTAAASNTWYASNRNNYGGSVAVINTLGHTLDITGVQVEPGSSATTFDTRLIGLEWPLVLRYYQVGQFNEVQYGVIAGTFASHITLPFPMRASPSIVRTSETFTNLTTPTITNTGTGFVLTAVVVATGNYVWSAAFAADAEIIV